MSAHKEAPLIFRKELFLIPLGLFAIAFIISFAAINLMLKNLGGGGGGGGGGGHKASHGGSHGHH